MMQFGGGDGLLSSQLKVKPQYFKKIQSQEVGGYAVSTSTTEATELIHAQGALLTLPPLMNFKILCP